MGDGKLTATQKAELRMLARPGSPSAYAEAVRALLLEHASLERDLAELRANLPPADGYQAGYLCAMEERNQAWRDLAELREAARKVVAATASPANISMTTQEHHDRLWRWQTVVLAATQRLATLLPAEPPKEASDGK